MRIGELNDTELDQWLGSAIMTAVPVALCLCMQWDTSWPRLGRQRKLRHIGACLG